MPANRQGRLVLLFLPMVKSCIGLIERKERDADRFIIGFEIVSQIIDDEILTTEEWYLWENVRW